MKPDHEINGRYFANGYILRDIPRENNYVMIIQDKTKYQVDQSLPLGKCYVELYDTQKTGCSLFDIKLDKSGKAVVLTELPKELERGFKITPELENKADNLINEMNKESFDSFIENDKKREQSDDELALHIFRNKVILRMGPLADERFKHDYAICCLIIKAMQEYHRRMSEDVLNEEEKEAAIIDIKHIIKCVDLNERDKTIRLKTIEKLDRKSGISSGLFTKEDMIDFAKSCWNEPNSYEDTLNQWLESKKK